MRILDFSDGFTSSSAPTIVGLAASGVTVTPSGNLGSSNVQSALTELQGDIDTINGKVGNANGIATLDAGGKVPSSQIPLVALVDVNVVADIAARDALTVQEGDVAVVTDAGSGVSKTYIYNGTSWTELVTDGSLYAHLTDTTDAHAGTAITNTPSGNLSATTVQAALNELQGDIDTINTNFTENAQDAVGAMVDTTLVYTDGTPALSRAALTGDVTASQGSNATTIANDAVTNAKLANMANATIKGRTTAGTGDPEDLTATQATALLNAMVGDSGSGGTKGLVPAPASGDATKYLKGDGTWASVSSGSGLTITSQTTTYSAAVGDLVLCSGSSFTVTLPTAVGNTNGRIKVMNNDTTARNITINTTSSQTYSGRASGDMVLKRFGDYAEFVSDGSNWIIVDKIETDIKQSGGSAGFSGRTAGDYLTTGNSITLGIGKWRLRAYFSVNVSTGTGIGLITTSGLYSADGGNSASTPTALSSGTNVKTVDGDVDMQNYIGSFNVNMNGIGSHARAQGGFCEVVVTIGGGTQAVYAVPKIDFSTTGSATAYVYLRAERIW